MSWPTKDERVSDHRRIIVKQAEVSLSYLSLVVRRRVLLNIKDEWSSRRGRSADGRALLQGNPGQGCAALAKSSATNSYLTEPLFDLAQSSFLPREHSRMMCGAVTCLAQCHPECDIVSESCVDSLHEGEGQGVRQARCLISRGSSSCAKSEG